MSAELDVHPVFGWGWVILNEPRLAVPEPFTISIQATDAGQTKRWFGTVTTADHEFAGAVADLTQRHVTWTGHVNVTVLRADEVVAQGFAEVNLG